MSELKPRRLLRKTVRRARRRVKRYARPAPQPPTPQLHRLVPSPVFLMSSVRSGSTLARVILNSHPQICAPHEMHLREIKVTVEDDECAADAMAGQQLSTKELETLLWDRVMYRELQRSGKQLLVDKTPQNIFTWRRLRSSWPDAHFLFLLRHPAAIARSVAAANPARGMEYVEERVLTYVRQLESVRQKVPGHVFRYEDLCADPAGVTRGICDYLGVPWEPVMLDYGQQDHGRMKRGLGDWSGKIRSGHIQPPAPLPDLDATPARLREFAVLWGYASAP